MRPNILRSRFSAVAQDEEVAQQIESIPTTRTASPAPTNTSDAHSLPSQTRWHRPPSPEASASLRSAQRLGSDDGTSQHRLSAKERFRSQVQQVLQHEPAPSGSGYEAVPSGHQRQGSRSEETLISDEYEPVKSYEYAGANISDYLGHYGGYYGGGAGFIIPMEEENPNIAANKDEIAFSDKNVVFDVPPAGFAIDPYSVSEHGYKGAEGHVEEQIPKSRPNYKPWTLKLWYPLGFVVVLLVFIGLTEYAARVLPNGTADSAHGFYQPFQKSPANQTELHRIARSLGLRKGKYGQWEVDPERRAEATGDGPNSPVSMDTPTSNGHGTEPSGTSGTSNTVNNVANAAVGQSAAPNGSPGAGSPVEGGPGSSPGTGTAPASSNQGSHSSPPPATGNGNGNGNGNSGGDNNNSPPPAPTQTKPPAPPPASTSPARPPAGNDPSTNNPPTNNEPPSNHPPASTLPANTPPANTPPANTPPANTPPANTPPANTPPANNPPANTPPANTPPANTPPANNPPANTPPANTPPANTPPANTPPANNPPANTPPANTPPANTAPGNGNPPGNNEPPAQGEPTKTNEQPPEPSSQTPTRPTEAPPTPAPTQPPAGGVGGHPTTPDPTTTEASTTTKPGGGLSVGISVSLPILGPIGGGNNPTGSPDPGNGNSPPGNGNGSNPPGNGNGSNPPGNGNGSNPPGNGNGSNPPGNGNGSNPPGNGNGSNPPGNGNGSNPPGNGNGSNPPGNGNGGDPGTGGTGGQPGPTTKTTELPTTTKPPFLGITLPPVGLPLPITVSIGPIEVGPPGNGDPGNGEPGNGNGGPGTGNGTPGNGGPGNGGPGNGGPGAGNPPGPPNSPNPPGPPVGVPGGSTTTSDRPGLPFPGGGVVPTLTDILPTGLIPSHITVLDPITAIIPTQIIPGPTGSPNPPNGPGFPGGPVITPTQPGGPPAGPTQQPPLNTDDGANFPVLPVPIPSFSISLPFQQPPQGTNPGNGGQTGGLPVQIPTALPTPTVTVNDPQRPPDPPNNPPPGATQQTPTPSPSNIPAQQPPVQQPPVQQPPSQQAPPTNDPAGDPPPATVPVPSPIATITRTETPAPSPTSATLDPVVVNNPSNIDNNVEPTTRQSIDVGGNFAAATSVGSLGPFTLTETDSLGVPTTTRPLQGLYVPVTMISTDPNGIAVSTWTEDVIYAGSSSTFTNAQGVPTKTELIFVVPTTSTVLSNGIPVSTVVSSVTNTPVVTTLTNAQGVPTLTMTYYAPVVVTTGVIVSAPVSASSVGAQNDQEHVGPGLSFLGMAVPTLLAVLLSVAARLFDHNARLYYPFHAMTQYAGAPTSDSLCFPAIGMGSFLAGYKLISRQQYLLAVTGTMVVFSAILTVLSGGAVHIIYTGDSCTKDSLGSPNCGTELAVFPTLARVVIAILSFIALCALLAMFILWRWRTGVWNNPWYIVNMLGMSTNQDIRTLLKNLREKDGRITRAQSAAALGPGPFMLDYWQENAALKYGILIGTSSQESLSGQNSRKEGKTGEMIRRKYRLLPQGNTVPFSVLTVIGRFWFLLLLCLLFIGVLTYNIFGGAEIQAGTAASGGQVFLSYLFVAAGVVVSFLWSSTFHAVAFMSPYRVLGRSGSRGIDSEDVLKMNPPTNIFSGMRSGFSRTRRDFFLGFVSIASLLSEFLPILLLNLPKAMAGKSDSAHTAITYVTVAILVGMILLLGSSFPMHWPHLPIDPSTIVGSLYYASDPGVIALSPSSGFLLDGKKSLNAQ